MDYLAIAWERTSGVVKGAACLAAAGAAFVAIAAIVKDLSASLPLVEIAFLQQATVVLLIAPGLATRGWSTMRTSRPGLHILRSTATAAGILLGFLAAKHLPIAEMTTLLFSRMVFTAGLAVLVLRERLRLDTWVGVALAGAGVILVLSPSADDVNVYGWAAVACAFAISVTMVLTRYMRSESRDAIVGWQGIGLTCALAVPAAMVWQSPNVADLLGCGVIGVLLWVSQHLNVWAYRYAEASTIQPVEATRLLVAVAVDFAVFGSLPGVWTVLGAAVIVSGVFATIGVGRRLAAGVEQNVRDKV